MMPESPAKNAPLQNVHPRSLLLAVHLAMAQSEWLVLIYLLVLSVFLLPLGRFSDIIGRRRLFLLGYFIFGAGSSFAAIMQNFEGIFAARVMTGLGGALLLSIGPAVLTQSFPPSQRGQVLGLIGLMTYLGLSMGPFLGGWLTHFFGWPAVFFLSVPISGIGLIIALGAIPHDEPHPFHPWDRRGTVFFALAMLSLVAVLNTQFLPHKFLWAILVVFLLSIIALVLQEQRTPAPLIDVTLFNVPNYAFGILATFFNYLCLFLVFFLLPFYLSNVHHETPQAIGTWMTLMPLIMMITAPVAGYWTDRIGARRLSSAGMIGNVLGLLSFALMILVPSMQTQALTMGLIVTGLGTGFFAAPNNTAIMLAAPKTHQGVASGTLSTARYIGMMAGITLGGSLFTAIDGFYRINQISHHYNWSFVTIMVIGMLLGIAGTRTTLATH